MIPLNIEWVPRPATRPTFWWTLLAVSAFALVVWVEHAWSLRRERQLIHQQILSASTVDVVSSAPKIQRRVQNPLYLEDALRWQRIASMPVARLFDAIEAVRLADFKLTSIEIDADTQTVKLEWVGPERLDVREVISQLEAGGSNYKWQLLSLQNDSGPGGLVQGVFFGTPQ